MREKANYVFVVIGYRRHHAVVRKGGRFENQTGKAEKTKGDWKLQ